MSKKRTLLGCVFLLITLLLACPAKTVEPTHIRYNADTPSEYEMKAIYLYNFLKFVKWPTDPCNLLGGKSQHIAVLGDTPLSHVLMDMQEKLKKHGKDLRLSFYGPYRSDMKFSCCCLLFIAGSERNNLSSILDQLTGKPVLTVADADSFMNRGVMISLFSQKNKIRWGINRQPVNVSGLTMSAKLLDIAVKVVDEKY
jgi:YfiR/HmsC-like